MQKEQLEKKLNTHPLVVPRLATLRKAKELNPQFNLPHIVGGYLRHIALDKNPNDCDVVFQGYMLNQPGILESVREAEQRLGLQPFPEWEFENSLATGYSGDFYADNLGKYSYHTDYLTMLMMDTSGRLYTSGEKTLTDLESRTYDLRFEGVDIWAKHRGGGRSYESCLMGDLIRALYLSHSLNLNISEPTVDKLLQFDQILSSLDPEDQLSRINFWNKKTKGNPDYQKILDKYDIKSL